MTTLFAMSIFEMVDGIIYRHENKLFTEEGTAVAAMNNKADSWKEMFHDGGKGEDVSKWIDKRTYNEISIVATDKPDNDNSKGKPTMLYIVLSEVGVEVKQVVAVS